MCDIISEVIIKEGGDEDEDANEYSNRDNEIETLEHKGVEFEIDYENE